MLENTPLYAALDLGSNSFHLLIARNIRGSVQIVARTKRKVRLAAGLNHHNQLSEEAMERGWQALRLFAELLRPLPAERVRVVATAALRIANNASVFLQQAEAIIGHSIQLISGQEEARLIYQGVAHTTGGPEQRLVIDIGGASTELIIGQRTHPTTLVSLPMGCVTWQIQHFKKQQLSEQHFAAAEQAAKAVLQPVIAQFPADAWQICVGASGTFQSIQNLMLAQGLDESISLDKLQQLKQQIIACGQLEKLRLPGLTAERARVFPGGLAILIAIFSELTINRLMLSGGALREGLIYDLLQFSLNQDIRYRTLQHLQNNYQLDIPQAEQVAQIASMLLQQIQACWQLDPQSRDLLLWACQLHEIGLAVNFKQAPQHAAYLIRHHDLPGFTAAQKKLLAALLLNQNHSIDTDAFHRQNAVSVPIAELLCRLLRLAIILASTRQQTTLAEFTLLAEGRRLSLQLPDGWPTDFPFRAEQLRQEIHWQQQAGWQLNIPALSRH